MSTLQTTLRSALPSPVPDYVSILLADVTARLKVRHHLTCGFESDFRRTFADAAHALALYHSSEPTKYNYFYGKVRERIDWQLTIIREQTRKPLQPIANSRQLKLAFDGPLTAGKPEPFPPKSPLH